ncbi:MAG: FAD-binding oxidoreductase [Caulobacteraceae bacterium]|nr:FAD-binding oxidoreductase [Caulobacteraceae bacterium]
MSDFLSELRAALGADAVAEGKAAEALAQSRWQRLGRPLAVVRPRSTAEVSTILRLAHAAGQPVTAWGGRTGLVEGAQADGALALSLERMDRILEVDPAGGTMTVEAGCILQSACEAAEAKGCQFPLDLGARGSATIGGNIATNAGGNRVIRFGMMRDMVLGLEAVLADGTVVSSMNRLIKNNAGYDLKQLFIGTEGTLGVVTRAVLRLRALPASQDTAFLAVDAFEKLPRLLRRLEQGLGGALSAFEVLWADFYQLVTSAPATNRPVLPWGHPYYVLTESLGGDREADAERFLRVLTEALETGEIADAAIAKSQAERDEMWALRDDVGQTSRHRPIYTFDVSLGIADMEAYVAAVRASLAERWPAFTLMVFGHLGDGNLHLIAGVGAGGPEVRRAVEERIYRPLAAIGGSISAEHGVGLQKRDFLALSRSAEEIALMRTLKRALDPRGILNPGKIFEA